MGLGVLRVDALLEATLDPPPLAGRDDARHEVELACASPRYPTAACLASLDVPPAAGT